MSEIQVELRLAALPSMLAEAEAGGLNWMTETERERLASMHSKSRRRQFTAGHWLLRCLAADVLGGEPQHWLVSARPDGIPSLRSPAYKGQGIAASISHSGDWVAAAIAPFPIGIDLECDTKPRDLLALAATAFSPDENVQLRRLPSSERAAAFYMYWTLKEAVGKREGHGLRLERTRRQQPVSCSATSADVVSWQFADCSLAMAWEVGTSIRVTGVPADARQRFWRIETVAG